MGDTLSGGSVRWNGLLLTAAMIIVGTSGVPLRAAAQINAFLPDRSDVAETEALPIDGDWMVSTIRKKIRIEQGRAFALEPWLHLLVLKVQPDMVVLQNFRRTGPGQYAADDLPLGGPATMTLNDEGNLDVSVRGALGPAKYALIRLQAQYPQLLKDEIMAATGQGAPPMLESAPSGTPAGPTPAQPSPREPAQRPAQPTLLPAPMEAAPPREMPEGCIPLNVDPRTGEYICA